MNVGVDNDRSEHRGLDRNVIVRFWRREVSQWVLNESNHVT